MLPVAFTSTATLPETGVAGAKLAVAVTVNNPATAKRCTGAVPTTAGDPSPKSHEILEAALFVAALKVTS